MTTAGFLREHIDVAYELGKFDDHSVQTPWSLVDKLVQTLPIKGNALVLYNPEFVWAMHEHGWDLASITLFADSPSKKKWADKIGINYITDLEGLDMKFDVVVGNPPYQDSDSSARNKKLWHSFTDVALSIGDLIAFVTPSSWVYADTSQMNSIRRKITRAGHVSSVVDTTHHFNVGVDTCYWIVDTKKPSNDTLINGTPYPLHKMPFKTENDIIADGIYDKLKSYTSIEFKSFNGDITRNQVCDAGDHLIYFSGNKPMYTNSHVDGAGVGKFVAPFSASPHNVFWTTEATGMLNQTIICDEATAEEYKAMWKLNVVKFFINTYRKTSGFTPAIRNGLIPDLRGYDNQQSYDVLDLTDEEIAYIEDNI